MKRNIAIFQCIIFSHSPKFSWKIFWRVLRRSVHLVLMRIISIYVFFRWPLSDLWPAPDSNKVSVLPQPCSLRQPLCFFSLSNRLLFLRSHLKNHGENVHAPCIRPKCHRIQRSAPARYAAGPRGPFLFPLLLMDTIRSSVRPRTLGLCGQRFKENDDDSLLVS